MLEWKNIATPAEGRCVNIDWLECYCEESIKGFPHDANFFREEGWQVREREYGTRQYNQMFMLLDNEGLPFIEIRREPVAAGTNSMTHGIFSEYSCHIRLSNRYCYHNTPILLYSEFLQRYEYTCRSIFRLDICMDFEKFDSGDNPQDFIKRYMKGKFSKINQSELAAHAKDNWSERIWSSLSWGSPMSMVGTKLYNKTKELREVKDKPYIRYAWQCAGLVTNFDTLTKIDAEGNEYKPTIWRLEFSIKRAKRWRHVQHAGTFVMEDNTRNKPAVKHIEHTLGCYDSKDKLLHAFRDLSLHYFVFKHFEDGVRKDRCRDKVLFKWETNKPIYKIDNLLTDAPKSNWIDALIKRLREYSMLKPQAAKPCNDLIELLTNDRISNTLPNPYDRKESRFLRLLLQRRDDLPNESITAAVKALTQMLEEDAVTPW